MKTYDPEINYVGTGPFKGDRYLCTDGEIDINWCAYQHDKYYSHHRFTRAEADKRFHMCMKIKIKKSTVGPDDYQTAMFKAKIYYMLVRLFGWFPYRRSKHRSNRKRK